MKIKSNIAISENGLIFNPGSGESFSVNPSGNAFIRLLQKEQDTDKIYESFAAEFDIDRPTFERDLADFLVLLKQYQLTDEQADI